MTYGVFCIKNTVTGDCYVGSSEAIETYWEQVREELNAGRHLSPKLLHHWGFYGADVFVWEIVEKTKPIPAVKFSRARYWQQKLKATYNGDRYASELMGKSGVYRILNTATDDFYIGASRNIQTRWEAHQRALNTKKHHSKKLQSSWDYYGADKFLFEILEECTNLRSGERDWFMKLKPTFNSLHP